MADTLMTAGKGKVVRAFRLVVSERRIDRDTVLRLRELLARAESGELIGVACAMMFSDTSWDYTWCGEARRDGARALGIVGALSTRIANEINED